MTNLLPFPEEHLGGKAALLKYVDTLFDEVESGEILGFAIAKIPSDPTVLRTAFGFVASEAPTLHRMIAAVSQLLYRLNRQANGEA